MAEPFSVRSGEVLLAGEESGEGPPVVLMHGLTATRRYVVMGSRALERSGHRVISYDARGHGSSSPAPGRDYGYEQLAGDLLAVLDARGVQRALLAGVSMGAHTALRVAAEHPERVAALAVITPGVDPESGHSEQELRAWDTLARALREGGIDGFVDAYDLGALPAAWRPVIERGLRQRMALHEHLGAVADSIELVPRTRPFAGAQALARISAPALVVGSRDEADPGHPLVLAERYADAIPGARMVVEDAAPPVRSPLAWQGGQLSKLLAQLAADASFA